MTSGNHLPSELRDVHRTRAYHALRQAWQEPVGLACSGGVDSTALLLLASRALQQGRVQPFTVLHVDHRERADSGDDAGYVKELCGRLGVPFELLDFSQQLPFVAGASREAQLRDARYRLMTEAAGRLGMRAIVTAHTLDDQAETILMRLISGSGALGSAGMLPRATIYPAGTALQIIRPLLGTSRQELEEVLDVAGVTPRIDPSNADPSYRRNALRAQVIPALRAIEPGFAAALVRSTALARDDGLVCDFVADDRFDELVTSGPAGAELERDVVRRGPPAIVRRVLRRAILRLSGSEGRELTFERVEAVRLAAGKRSNATIELPDGVVAVIEGRKVRISHAEATLERAGDER